MSSTPHFSIQEQEKYTLTMKSQICLSTRINNDIGMKSLESVWQMKLSPDSPDLSTQSAKITHKIDSPVDSIENTYSEGIKSPSLFDTPPVQFCYAPKNQNSNKKLTSKTKKVWVFYCVKTACCLLML